MLTAIVGTVIITAIITIESSVEVIRSNFIMSEMKKSTPRVHRLLTRPTVVSWQK